jgi:hypothetical protein
MGKTTVVFLSWHNSLPGYIKKLYYNLPLNKAFISREHIKPPKLVDVSLMSSRNSYREPSDEMVIKRIKNLNATHVVVWNGDFNDNERGFQVPLINLIKSQTKSKLVYCEHGWLPQAKTFTIDLMGSNGGSSISNSVSIPVPIDYRPMINKLKQYNNAAKDPGIRNYIYLPLQLNTDTQIVKYSPFFKDMGSLINHIAGLFKTQIIVKVHPKDTSANKERYKKICNQYSHVKFVEDRNNIGWCKFANRVISINSTSINEALLFHKPIMTYGKNNFYGKGITYEIKDIKDTDYQKEFLNYSPNVEKCKNYINFLLSKQFDKENPNIQKALTYFQ